MEIGELLDEARKVTGCKSDTELAKRLGITPNSMSNYRSGYSLPKVSVCEKLAKITGKKPLSVIALVEEKRALGNDEKAVWRRLASAAAVLLFVLPFQGQTAPHGMDEHKPVICIMRNIIRARTLRSGSPWHP